MGIGMEMGTEERIGMGAEMGMEIGSEGEWD